jgi:hypothetical protein
MSDTDNVPAEAEKIYMPPIRVALIIDNKVEEIIFAEDRLGAILLSEPLMLEIVQERATSEYVAIGDYYDPETDKFFRTRSEVTPLDYLEDLEE